MVSNATSKTSQTTHNTHTHIHACYQCLWQHRKLSV